MLVDCTHMYVYMCKHMHINMQPSIFILGRFAFLPSIITLKIILIYKVYWPLTFVLRRSFNYSIIIYIYLHQLNYNIACLVLSKLWVSLNSLKYLQLYNAYTRICIILLYCINTVLML